jgi:RNA polymerase sigma-70 factor (ECF subfamily)
MVDEAELSRAMDRYAEGDASAFVPLHRGLAPRLRAFLARLVGDAATADDLLQETFFRMHRARGSFQVGAPVVPWAYAIARNVSLDHARASRTRRTERLPSDPGLEPSDLGTASGESAAIANQAASVVQRVLAGLPPAQREAFILLRYEGFRVQDAAELLGTTPTAVKLRAFRAYEALRAALGESTAEDRAARNQGTS